MLHSRHIEMNTTVTALSVQFPATEVVLFVPIQFATHETLCTRCVFNVETPFSVSATWKRCTCCTTVASQTRSDAFDAIGSMFSRRNDSACDATCGKLEICRARAIILSPLITSYAQHICFSIHVARGSCCWHTLTSQRKLTKSDKEAAVDTQSVDPLQFDQCTGTRDTNFTTWSDSVPRNRCYVACSDPVCHPLTRLLRTSEMNEEWAEHVHGEGNSPAL